MSRAEQRGARARRLFLRLAVAITIPTCLAAIYYGFLATSQFQSVTVLAIQHVALETTPAKKGTNDSAVVRDFLLSRSVVERLNQCCAFDKHYQEPRIDRLSRLPSDAGGEKTFEYFLDHVVVNNELGEPTLTLAVRAFDPKEAQRFATEMVAATREKLAELNVETGRDAINSAEKLVVAAEAKQFEASLALQNFTSQQGDLREKLRSETKLHLATRHSEVAAQTLENLRASALANHRELQVLSPPSLPDVATYPRRIWSIATVFVLSTVLLGIGTLIAGSIREHAKF